jgi:protoporphyrinogen oxidase
VAISRPYILGAGVAGLAAGLATGFPILEASSRAGGICRSYERRLPATVAVDNQLAAYRFEVGGGHWIHTRYPVIRDFLASMTPVDMHIRNTAVYLPDFDRYVPYPLQEHLHHLPDTVAARIREERQSAGVPAGPTMRDHFEQLFGPTLCGLFFHPFHELYTAGLYSAIAPQDPFKTPPPGDAPYSQAPSSSGYNATFMYPRHGFNPMIDKLAGYTSIEFGREAVEIDPERKHISLRQGGIAYTALISTVPLNAMQRMAGIATRNAADPHTSVLVINIGALRGPRCPDYHWIYFPHSASGFHRIGIYSNVSPSFIPVTTDGRERASFYVECSYPSDSPPAPEEIDRRCLAVVEEMRAMGYLIEPEIIDPSFVELAYTWRRPGSTWAEELMDELRKRSIFQTGRYAAWRGYGIADSIRDGFLQGRALAGLDRELGSEPYAVLAGLEER